MGWKNAREVSVGTCDLLAPVMGRSVSPSLPALPVEIRFRATELGFLDANVPRDGVVGVRPGVVGVLGPPVMGRAGGKPVSPGGPVSPRGSSRRPLSLSGRQCDRGADALAEFISSLGCGEGAGPAPAAVSDESFAVGSGSSADVGREEAMVEICS